MTLKYLASHSQRLGHITMYRQCYLLQKQWECEFREGWVLEWMTFLVEKSENHWGGTLYWLQSWLHTCECQEVWQECDLMGGDVIEGWKWRKDQRKKLCYHEKGKIHRQPTTWKWITRYISYLGTNSQAERLSCYYITVKKVYFLTLSSLSKWKKSFGMTVYYANIW